MIIQFQYNVHVNHSEELKKNWLLRTTKNQYTAAAFIFKALHLSNFSPWIGGELGRIERKRKMSNWQWVLVFFVSVFVNGLKLTNCSNGSTAEGADPIEQQISDRVSDLPGQGFNVNFAHYAGFVTVNEEAGRALFYWFFETAEEPSTKPLVLWLNGGPGCSSIGYGMAEELGPFFVEKDGRNLYPNPYSWNQVANVLFLDSPVGVGYSYSNTSSDILTSGDNRTAADSLTFLVNWFERFPQYKGREFYIAGESYAGHYVPQLSQAIVSYNSGKQEKSINFRGFMVGNALFDNFYDHLGIFQYLWSIGLISDQTFKKLNIACDLDSLLSPAESCQKILDIANKEMGDIDQTSVFTPACPAKFSLLNQFLKRRNVGNLGRQYDPCTELYSTKYFNLPEVQRALHVYNRDNSSTWVVCRDDIYASWKDSPSSMLNIYRELLQVGIRIWVFSGDTDATVPVAATRFSLDALHLPTVEPWRPWYEDGQVGGWTQQYEGLTFVAVRGAGHEVPLHRPKEALTLFKSFLSGTPLPNKGELRSGS